MLGISFLLFVVLLQKNMSKIIQKEVFKESDYLT